MEAEKTIELLLLYLRVRLASEDITGAQIITNEITKTLKGEPSKDRN